MHPTAPGFDSEQLYRSRNTDLQRRIEVMGRLEPHTFGTLKNVEIWFIVLLGILAPLVLAWCLL